MGERLKAGVFLEQACCFQFSQLIFILQGFIFPLYRYFLWEHLSFRIAVLAVQQHHQNLFRSRKFRNQAYSSAKVKVR